MKTAFEHCIDEGFCRGALCLQRIDASVSYFELVSVDRWSVTIFHTLS